MEQSDGDAVRNALPYLAQNLAVAAALTKSFLDGYDAGWGASGEGHNGEYTSKRFTEEKYVEARMAALTKEYTP